MVDQFDKKDMDTLRNRFQVMRSRAKKEKIPFAWSTFNEYLTDLVSVAPAGYNPNSYRVVHDHAELKKGGLGYCLDTMSIKFSKAGEIKRKRDATADHAEVVATLASILLDQAEPWEGDYRQLEYSWEMAKALTGG